jgi:enoyl-CoA hydratase/carnithine racemase
MYQDIEFSVEQRIATITFNRPEVFNAIRVQTYQEVISALKDCEQRDDVSVIIITGAAGKFCAGNDLTDLLPEGDLAGVQQGVAGIFDTLAAMQKPLILAQEGVAVGIGANLLLHADLAFAGRSIRYSLPFSKIGVAAEGGSSVLLKEMIGPKAAADLLLTGRFFSAEEAERWGFINKAVDDGSALEHAQQAATELLKNSQDAIRAIKQLGRREDHRQRVNTAVKAEMEAFSQLLQTPETQMRIQQVLKGKG